MLANFAELVPGSLLAVLGLRWLVGGVVGKDFRIALLLKSRFLDFVLHPASCFLLQISRSTRPSKSQTNLGFLPNQQSLFLTADSPLVASPHSLHSLVLLQLACLSSRPTRNILHHSVVHSIIDLSLPGSGTKEAYPPTDPVETELNDCQPFLRLDKDLQYFQYYLSH